MFAKLVFQAIMVDETPMDRFVRAYKMMLDFYQSELFF